MSVITENFTAVGNGAQILVRHMEGVDYAVTGVFVGTAVLESSKDGGVTWTPIVSLSTTGSGSYLNESRDRTAQVLRFRCSAYTSGTIGTTITEQGEVKPGSQFYDQDGNVVAEIFEGGMRFPLAVTIQGVLTASGGVSLGAALTALAGLAPAADKVPYFTGAAAAALADLTAFARTMLDDADAAAVRTTLGLVIGTDVQAFDATLASIAALGTAADKMLYTTGLDVWAEAPLTAAGRAILDDADAAAQRATLGAAKSGVNSDITEIQGLTTPLTQAQGGTGTSLGMTYDGGRHSLNFLRLASNVAEGETVTIGADVYEVEIVNTDTTDDTQGGDFNNTTNPLTVTGAVTTYTNTTFAVGRLIRIGTEILRVTAVVGNDVTFARGVSGTTNAAHADAQDIYEGNGIVTGIAVGLVADLSNSAFGTALTDDINNEATEAVSATKGSATHVLLWSTNPVAITLACAETLAGANNEWAAANMFGGRAQGQSFISVGKRVPTAAEVAVGYMYFVFGFNPTSIRVLVAPTATPGAYKLWDGALLIASNVIRLDNSGAVDWATTDDVCVIGYL